MSFSAPGVTQASGTSVQRVPNDPPPAAQGNYGALGLLASTGFPGFALVNATPNIIQWTAPNDGKLHRVFALTWLTVTTLETGGQINFGTPDFTIAQVQLYAAALGTGQRMAWQGMIVPPGETAAVLQFSALSGGAAVLAAELWGS